MTMSICHVGNAFFRQLPVDQIERHVGVLRQDLTNKQEPGGRGDHGTNDIAAGVVASSARRSCSSAMSPPNGMLDIADGAESRRFLLRLVPYIGVSSDR